MLLLLLRKGVLVCGGPGGRGAGVSEYEVSVSECGRQRVHLLQFLFLFFLPGVFTSPRDLEAKIPEA